MAPGAGGSGGLSGLSVALGGSLRPRGFLQRIEQCDVIHVGIAKRREHRLHRVVLALAAPVVLHCGDEVLRLLSDQIRCPRGLADARLAVASRAGRRRGLAGLDRIDDRWRARLGGLGRIEVGVIGRHFDQCVIAQELDPVDHLGCWCGRRIDRLSAPGRDRPAAGRPDWERPQWC